VVIIVFKVYQLRVDECVFAVSVADELHYVKQVFGLVVFHCGLSMAKSVEGLWIFEAWLLNEPAYSFGNALSMAASFEDIEDSGVALVFWVVLGYV